MSTRIYEPPPGRIAESQLVCHDVDAEQVRQTMECLFKQLEEPWGDAGSPFKKWYCDMSSGPEERSGTRQIAWKTGKPFSPRYAFFRTIDTGRLLPACNATFRVQFYAYKSYWWHLDAKGKRESWIQYALGSMMHELVILRNRRDIGGADIPIIFTEWDIQYIDKAIDFWVEQSKGQWSEEEYLQKYRELEDGKCRRLLPCFFQVDILLRALFSDPEVGFFPPFVIIMPASNDPDPRGRVLYANPSDMPDRSLLETFPMICGSPRCDNTECGFINLKATRALSAGTTMVRDDGWPPNEVLCNLWGCNKPHLPEEGKKLLQCQKCKEVYYCSPFHQHLDWGQHKDVCEARHKRPV